MAKMQLAVIVLFLLAISASVCTAATINIVNRCSSPVTACDQAQGTGVTCYALQGGASQSVNVGATWVGGLIWGFPGASGNPGLGNTAKPQVNLAEFTIGTNGQDSYDMSLVNAYNLPMAVGPTTIAGGGSPNGASCGTISCTINNLSSFCQAPNTLTGNPGDGCYNTDGPGNVPTPGTEAFKNACPNAYSYSKDDTNNPPVVYTCAIGSDYQVVFCPS